MTNKIYTDSMDNLYAYDDRYGWSVMSFNTHMNLETGEYDQDDCIGLPNEVMDALLKANVLTEES